MRPIQLRFDVSMDAESAGLLFNLLTDSVAKGTAHCKPKETRVADTEASVTPSRRITIDQTSADDEELLIDSHRAAKLLNVSPRKLWSMQAGGEMPKPIRIGRLVRWNIDELKEWVEAGCPNCNQ